MTRTEATGRRVIPPDAVTCSHCLGEGECYCPTCAPGQDVEGSYREEPDTGRQMEGTCRICNGLGKTNPDGTSIEF